MQLKVACSSGSIKYFEVFRLRMRLLHAAVAQLDWVSVEYFVEVVVA